MKYKHTLLSEKLLNMIRKATNYAKDYEHTLLTYFCSVKNVVL